MLSDADANDPRHRLAAAAILLSPFTPMLFMGEEYGETAPFPYFVDHSDPELVDAVRQGREREFSGSDWSGDVADPSDPATFEAAVLDPTLTEGDPHRSRLAMYTELLRIRRAHSTLTDPRASQDVSLTDDLMIVVRANADATVTIMLNFSPVAVETVDEVMGTRVFDSDEDRWGGPGLRGGSLGAWSARLVVS